MSLLSPPVCDFGWRAPRFSLPAANGVQHSFAQHLTPRGLLVMFICNHCPYVQRIGKQLAQVSDALIADGIGVLAVMSNDVADYPEDGPDKMPEYAERYGWRFPYLIDEAQTVGRDYGAACTPDFFGLNGLGELQYRGDVDGLLAAMTQIADTGKGPTTQTPSIGCSIKWRTP